MTGELEVLVEGLCMSNARQGLTPAPGRRQEGPMTGELEVLVKGSCMILVMLPRAQLGIRTRKQNNPIQNCYRDLKLGLCILFLHLS